MKQLFEQLNSIGNKINFLNKQEIQISEKIKEIHASLVLLLDSRNFLVDFSEYTKQKVKCRIEDLVNTSLQAVFTDKQMEFLMLPNQTKRGLSFDLYLKTNNNLMPLQESKGGGVLDIVSLAIRISFLKMFGNLRQVLILDEPLKNMDKERGKLAISWLKTISEQLKIQFIIISHEEDIIEKADRIIVIKNIDDVSKVEIV